MLGSLPIALGIGIGIGAEARRPLGIAVVRGPLFSPWLTLYITPTFFVSMERLAERLAERRAGRDRPAY